MTMRRGMPDPRPPLTLQQQADFIDLLIQRSTMRDGSTAGEAYLLVSGSDVDDLKGIRDRLRRMVPHEAAIRRVVVGK